MAEGCSRIAKPHELLQDLARVELLERHALFGRFSLDQSRVIN